MHAPFTRCLGFGEDMDEFFLLVCDPPKDGMPNNVVSLSMITWMVLTSFCLHPKEEYRYLKPNFMFGRFSMDADGRKKISVSLHVHCGVLDGRCASMLVSRMEEELSR